MRNIASMMKKAQEMQSRLENLQADLESQNFSASDVNNLVNVAVDGNGFLQTVKIARSVINPDEGELIEDLICVAIRNAQRAAAEEKKRLTKDISDGLPIPPNLN